MAVLSGANVIPVYAYGQADLIALFALKSVSPGDTIDLGTIGNNASFMVIVHALVLSTSGPAGIASITGTVVTMPAAIPASSSGYLLAWGC